MANEFSHLVEYLVLVDNVAKRDTAAIMTTPFELDAMKNVRIFVYNSLDQGFNVTFQYSRDGGTNWYTVGAQRTVAANSGATVFKDSTETALSLLRGKVKITIDGFAAAPTNGNLVVDVQTMP